MKFSNIFNSALFFSKLFFVKRNYDVIFIYRNTFVRQGGTTPLLQPFVESCQKNGLRYREVTSPRRGSGFSYRIEFKHPGNPKEAALPADHLPPPAEVHELERRAIAPQGSEHFEIVASEGGERRGVLIPPDTRICPACLAEMEDPADRRHRYPFTTCTECGPRFSIIEGLPYDRPKTTMREFEMCPACAAEYADPASRRHHAQPIACPDCGPRMEPADWEAVWKESMEQGRIVAVKGIGGFHLACDALNPEAVSKLRKRKGREAKPFALMVPNLGWIKGVCKVSVEEEKLLLSRERPIVLLKLREGQAGKSAPQATACTAARSRSAP